MTNYSLRYQSTNSINGIIYSTNSNVVFNRPIRAGQYDVIYRDNGIKGLLLEILLYCLFLICKYIHIAQYYLMNT